MNKTEKMVLNALKAMTNSQPINIDGQMTFLFTDEVLANSTGLKPKKLCKTINSLVAKGVVEVYDNTRTGQQCFKLRGGNDEKSAEVI